MAIDGSADPAGCRCRPWRAVAATASESVEVHAARATRQPGRGPIHGARVEEGQPQPLGDPACGAGLARTARPVDRHDERAPGLGGRSPTAVASDTRFSVQGIGGHRSPRTDRRVRRTVSEGVRSHEASQPCCDHPPHQCDRRSAGVDRQGQVTDLADRVVLDGDVLDVDPGRARRRRRAAPAHRGRPGSHHHLPVVDRRAARACPGSSGAGDAALELARSSIAVAGSGLERARSAASSSILYAAESPSTAAELAPTICSHSCGIAAGDPGDVTQTRAGERQVAVGHRGQVPAVSTDIRCGRCDTRATAASWSSTSMEDLARAAGGDQS